MNPLKLLAATLTAPLLLSACSTGLFRTGPTSLYNKDGQLVNLATCERAGWRDCMEQAGNQCRTVGYTILEKQSALGYDGKNELIFVCKGDPDALDKTTQAPLEAK